MKTLLSRARAAATAGLAALALACPLASAAAQAPDTTPKTEGRGAPFFNRRDALVAAGLTVTTVAFLPLDRSIAGGFQGEGPQRNQLFRAGAAVFRNTAVPGALIIGTGLYTVGRVGHHARIAELGLHGTEAVVFAAGTTFLVKGLAGRARPYLGHDDPHDFQLGRGFRKGDDFSSFPSGHTAAAFAAAAAVTSETSRWWPKSKAYVAPVMYGGATLVGVSRLYNDKHWASDVVMGAAIGTLSGLKVVEYQHRHPGNRIDRWLLPDAVVPTPDGATVVAWVIPTR
jgi:membrane-associated phospholipid phosphatase